MNPALPPIRGPMPPAQARRPAAAGAQRDWREASDADLVEHILARFHAVHREQLPALERLARKVERVHEERGDCPHGLADLLASFAQEMESHMRKEEQVLFPMILRGQGRLAAMPIQVMRMEHDEHGESLRRIAELTGDLVPPKDACGTWRTLYAGLEEFRCDLLEHIHTENDILFERHAPLGPA